MHFLLFAALAVQTAETGELKNDWYEHITMSVWGSTKEEGIADGRTAVAEKRLELIVFADFYSPIYLVAKNGEYIDLFNLQDFTDRYRPPLKSTSDPISDKILLSLIASDAIPRNPKGRAVQVCTIEYAAWYNTVIMNYYITHPESLKEHLRKCADDDMFFTLENTDIYPLPGNEEETRAAKGDGNETVLGDSPQALPPPDRRDVRKVGRY